ncbi:MAG: histidine phosphatase family protein, partial [Oscillospiraceae bacterium]
MNDALLNLLRGGGYILYARHGEATVGDDQPDLNFRDCATQRNLSEIGRIQAIYYGEYLRALQIPVSHPIIASPFCRTVETAQLAFRGANISVDPFWVEIY